jgi:predicted N-acetyltransferase YhbS
MSATARGRAREPVNAVEASTVSQPLWSVTSATAGDHLEIHRLLRCVAGQPSAAEFHAQTDAPQYEPRDRLLIRHEGRIIAHLRTLNREMSFGAQTLPVAWLADLATLPEHRGQGCAAALLAAAEQRVREDGAILALVRAARPEFYRGHGWVDCGDAAEAVAGAREVLARLHAEERLTFWPKRPALHLRHWRKVELSALVRLYDETTQHAFGASVRNLPDWAWLIGRHAYDHILVAVEGSPRLELTDSMLPIVGYAFVQGRRLVELLAAARRPDAARTLLARACGDAIERGFQEIRLAAPARAALVRLLQDAGGRLDTTAAPCLAKLFDVPAFIERLGTQWWQRRTVCTAPLASELGLRLDEEPYVLQVVAEGTRLRPGRPGRNYLTCSRALFTQCLLGTVDLPAAVARGEIAASTRLALDTARVLFPRLPLWFPPLDDLPAP